MPVAPNREFWMHVLEEKIKATIGNEGDMIGWPSDKESVGPIAFAAKQVPSTSRSIYTASRYTRPFFVSFGSRTRRLRDTQYNHCEAAKWRTYYHLAIRLETACIWPAVLSDPLVAVCPVDLHVTAAGFPMISRIPSDATEADGRMHERWATHYVKRLYEAAPDYKAAMKAGGDFRYLWYSLQDWRGNDPEGFFGDLGGWAEERIECLKVT
ncbi:unnamed protein product [Fusarium graminearum]|uniref:Uncharacterized protein n=1 Tax=Gibberella zeae TaxID=5518 RepID=A0A4E9ELG7_GIBZA|nr:unnamed protein product [Fusarium graminearum]